MRRDATGAYCYRGARLAQTGNGWTVEAPGRLSFADSLKAAQAIAEAWKAQEARGCAGEWKVRFNIDDAPDGRGRVLVEDDEGLTMAEVPFGGPGRLGHAAAEKVARQIAALPAGRGS